MGKRPLVIAALLLPLLLAACASAPPASRLKLPAAFVQPTPAADDTAAASPWWQLFEDPQLDALIEAALANNRDVQVAVEQVERARALHRADRSLLLPAGSATAGASRARVPAIATATGQAELRQQVGVTAGPSWEPDLFGRLRSRARAGALAAGASAADLALLRTVVLADVASAYFAWQGVSSQQAALGAIAAGQRRQVELAHGRYTHGASDELELRRLRGELRTTEARLAALAGDAARLESQLAVLTGRFPGDLSLQYADTPAAAVRAVAVPAPAVVLARRPDVAAAASRLRAAAARSDAAWADLLPRLTIGGSIGVIAGRGSDLSGDAARAWSLQPALTLPLLDLLQLAPLRAARQAETRIALAEYEQSVLAAVADVEAAVARHRAATEQVSRLAQRRDDAERALAIAAARHDAGAIDQLTLIDAERQRRAAAVELAVALAEHRIAVVQLHRALGLPAEPPRQARSG